MIELVIRFRSQGMSWPLRANDTVEVRNEQHDAILEFPGELILELSQHYYRSLEIQQAMATGRLPIRKPLAVSTPDLLEKRRLARRKKKA